MGDEFAIDKGISIPPLGFGREKYPYSKMDVGDSFFVPGKNTTQMSASLAGQRERNGRRFISRTLTENGVNGVRVWRVE